MLIQHQTRVCLAQVGIFALAVLQHQHHAPPALQAPTTKALHVQALLIGYAVHALPALQASIIELRPALSPQIQSALRALPALQASAMKPVHVRAPLTASALHAQLAQLGPPTRPLPALAPQIECAPPAALAQLGTTGLAFALALQTPSALRALRALQAPIMKQLHALPPPTGSALLALVSVQREIT